MSSMIGWTLRKVERITIIWRGRARKDVQQVRVNRDKDQNVLTSKKVEGVL